MLFLTLQHGCTGHLGIMVSLYLTGSLAYVGSTGAVSGHRDHWLFAPWTPDEIALLASCGFFGWCRVLCALRCR